MKSTMRLANLVLACGALTAIGCRNDVSTSPDVVQHTDAARDGQTGTDVPPGTDVAPGTDVQPGTDVPTGTDVPQTDGSSSTNVTIQSLQNLSDAMHPAPGTRITLNQTGMIALTPRMLIGSVGGDSSGRCRFGVWVGDGTHGPYSGVIVEETLTLGDAGTCFNATARQIPDSVQPGDSITLVDAASYDEFCAGATGTSMTACANWEQTEVFGPRTFTVGGHGSAPTAASVTLSQVGATSDDNPGAMTTAYEGVLLTLSNVTVTAMMNDASSVPDFRIGDPADPSHTLMLQVSNFPHTSCVRSYLSAHSGSAVASVTGVLLPNFGKWTLKIRDENDIAGVGSCATTDGGVADASMDGGG